jgi:hypothetical protein
MGWAHQPGKRMQPLPSMRVAASARLVCSQHTQLAQLLLREGATGLQPSPPVAPNAPECIWLACASQPPRERAHGPQHAGVLCDANPLSGWLFARRIDFERLQVVVSKGTVEAVLAELLSEGGGPLGRRLTPADTLPDDALPVRQV